MDVPGDDATGGGAKTVELTQAESDEVLRGPVEPVAGWTRVGVKTGPWERVAPIAGFERDSASEGEKAASVAETGVAGTLGLRHGLEPDPALVPGVKVEA